MMDKPLLTKSTAVSLWFAILPLAVRLQVELTKVGQLDRQYYNVFIY